METKALISPQEIAAIQALDREAQHGNAQRLWNLCAAIFTLYSRAGITVRDLQAKLTIVRSRKLAVCKVSGERVVKNAKHCKPCGRQLAADGKLKDHAGCESVAKVCTEPVNPSLGYLTGKIAAYQWASGAEVAANGPQKARPQGVFAHCGTDNPFDPATKNGCTDTALAAEFVSRAHGNDNRDKTTSRKAKSWSERVVSAVKYACGKDASPADIQKYVNEAIRAFSKGAKEPAPVTPMAQAEPVAVAA